MRLCFIGCEVLTREVAALAALAGATVDLHFLPHGLHNDPDALRIRVQEEIDRVESGEGRANLGGPFGRAGNYQCDAILLGYGLCSNGTVGLHAGRFPLVIPRAHDCITLFLGSKEAYQEYFDSHRGVYWYTAGWIERSLQPGPERLVEARRRYTEKFGADNADYLMETEMSWYREYSWATYVDWGLPAAEEYRRYTRACAKYLSEILAEKGAPGWQYDERRGDPSLMEDWLNGRWDERRFLVVPSGQAIAPSYDRSILKAVPAE